jgi:putative oxidoreductase
MPAPVAVRRAAALGLRFTEALSFLAPLLTRLVIGYAFYQAGGGKLANMERTVEFFAGLGIPFPAANAGFIARLELYGGMLLVVGLGTRIVASLLGSTMAVALSTADKEPFLNALKGVGDDGLTDVVPVVYGLFLLWLVLFGPGLASLDALVRKWIAPRPDPSKEPDRLAV